MFNGSNLMKKWWNKCECSYNFNGKEINLDYFF